MASLLLLAMVTAASSWALPPAQMKTLDQALRAGRPAPGAGRAMAEFAKQVEGLEKRMIPVAYLFNRLAPELAQRMNELNAVETYLKQNPDSFVNPYSDRGWVQSARKETGYVCCDVRRSSRLAREIQENLAQGLPALSDSMSEKVGTRARTAASGRALVEYGGETTKTPPPAVSPAAGNVVRSAPPSSANKGLSTKVISGLPAPSGQGVPSIPTSSPPPMGLPGPPPPTIDGK